MTNRPGSRIFATPGAPRSTARGIRAKLSLDMNDGTGNGGRTIGLDLSMAALIPRKNAAINPTCGGRQAQLHAWPA